MKSDFFKKTASIIIAAALLAGYAPVGSIADSIHDFAITASADEINYDDAVTVSTWNDLQEAINSAETGDVIVLTSPSSGNWVKPTEEGSSIHIPAGKTVTLELQTSIYRSLNEAVDDGCVFRNEGNLTIIGGKYISGGNNAGDGGGIYNSGTLTIDSYVDDNKAKRGGGIFNDGTLVLRGHRVSSNEAEIGGGIYNTANGTIIFESVSQSDSGTFITNNEATTNYGGIYNEGKLEMKCFPYVYNNYIEATEENDYTSTNSNLYLANDTVIDFDSDIDLDGISFDYRNLYVGMESPRVFTSGFSAYKDNETIIEKYFKSDDERYDPELNDDGEFNLGLNYWGLAADVCENGGTVKLEKDAVSNGSFLHIPAGVETTIDLNGHTIDRGLGKGNVPEDPGYWSGEQNESGCIIMNEGTLTIMDSSAEQTGKLTGGYSDSFYSYVGGGVYNLGTFTLLGGSITGNVGHDGAVTNGEDATFNLFGGSIIGNYEASGGAYSGGTINIKGSPVVKDNYISGRGGFIPYNVCTTVNIVGELDEGADLHASVGTNVFTNGYSKFMGDQDPNKFFTHDFAAANIILNDDGEAECTQDSYLTGTNLMLDGKIGIVFNFNISPYDEVALYTEWGDSKRDMYLVEGAYGTTATVYLTPKELCEDIKFSVRKYHSGDCFDGIHWGDELNTDFTEIEGGTFNVRTDYLDKIINGEYDESEKSLAKATANYCAAAQKLFNYKTDNLVNKGINYVHGENIPDISELTSEFTSPEDVHIVEADNNVDDTFSYCGSSLILENSTVLRHYFKIERKGDTVYNYKVYGDNLLNQSGYPMWLKSCGENSDYYYIDTYHISAEDLSKGLSLNVYKQKSNESWGERIINFTYSPMDYVYYALRSSDIDENAKKTAEALFYYSQEANAYIQAHLPVDNDEYDY